MTEQLQYYSGEISNVPTTILSYFSILVPPQKCKMRDKDFLSEKASPACTTVLSLNLMYRDYISSSSDPFLYKANSCLHFIFYFGERESHLKKNILCSGSEH